MKLEIKEVSHGISTPTYRKIYLTDDAEITIWAKYAMSYKELKGDYILPTYPRFGRKVNRVIDFVSEEYWKMTDEEVLKIVQDRIDQNPKAGF